MLPEDDSGCVLCGSGVFSDVLDRSAFTTAVLSKGTLHKVSL